MLDLDWIDLDWSTASAVAAEEPGSTTDTADAVVFDWIGLDRFGCPASRWASAQVCLYLICVMFSLSKV